MLRRLLATVVLLGSLPLQAGAQDSFRTLSPAVWTPLRLPAPSSFNETARTPSQGLSIAEDPPISLRRAVEIALERNPTLAVERIHVAQAQERIVEERGAFDPLFSIQATESRKDNLVASRFYPSGLYLE